MGNAVQDPAPTRQAQPPELPKWGVGGSALLPGRLFSPSSRRRHLSTVSAWHRSHCPPYSSPKLQWDAAGSPPGSCIPHAPHPPTPPSHCTCPALGQPAQPLRMPRGTQPSPMHPAASLGNQGCSGMGRSKNIPKFILESLSKAREQIRDFTLPMFLQLQHSCTACTSLF